MNLVDSSGWLEYFADGQNAGFFAPAIESIDQLLVSTIDLYEVFKLIYLRQDEESALQAAALMLQARVVDISATLAIEAARFSADNQVPMADSIIYQCSLQHSATLWTQDADLEPFPGVRYVKA